MSEHFFQAPTPEELSATYKGIAFEEFKQLNDEAVNTLRLQERKEWSVACEKSTGFDDEWWEARDKTGVFSYFCEWRKYGVPDRDITEDEFLERMYQYADSYRAKDPDFGQLSAADYDHLTEDEIELTNWALDEAWHDGDSWTGQPIVDEGGDIQHVVKRLGVSLDTLVAKQILENYTSPADILFNEGTGYVLAGKFAMHLFSLRYSEAEREDIE